MRTPGASVGPRQLRLFDEAPAAAPGARAVRDPAVTASPTTPAAPPAPSATRPGRDRSAASPHAASAAPAAERSVPSLAPAPLLRHPEAAREVALDGHAVAYALRRARRRSIGFVVSPDGLAVAAPRWASLAQIETALRDKAGWILRKLAEQQERARRRAESRIDWADGAAIPFLGETLTLRLDGGGHGALLEPGTGGPRVLRLGLPPAALPAQVRDAVQAWLQRQARRVFDERCALYAPRLGVRVTRLSLSSAQTRWGSASSNGSVRLNWRLIHLGLPLIDYVVVHELAHLRHMDHSPQFWDVVRSAVPDYESRRGRLRDDVLPVWD